MTKRIVFEDSIGFVGCTHRTVEEFDDSATDDEITEAWEEWRNNHNTGGWWPEEG